MSGSLLITNGMVLSPGAQAPGQADVLIEDERIAAVGPKLAAPADAARLDATGRLIMPGLVNAHTHAHNNLIRSLEDGWTLELFLNAGSAMFRGRTVEEQYLSALLGAVEMLKTGATAAYDLFLEIPAPSLEAIEAVVRAYTDAGMRVVVAPAMADMMFHDTVPGLLDAMPDDLRREVEKRRPAAEAGAGVLKTVREALVRWRRAAGGRVQMAVAPTIPGQCSDAFLLGCARLADEFGTLLHTHLAESKVQALNGLRRYGVSLTRHLHGLGILGPRFTAAHSIWLDGDDIALLADAGASVAHNPASNMKIGSGIAPIAEMLARGVNVGLGTDGVASSDNLNMFEALRIAALVAKVRTPEYPTWVSSRQVLAMATQGGARALGFGDALGQVAPGFLADLVLVNLGSTYFTPLNDLTNQLVYAETGADVETVIVGGRIVAQGGRVLTVDEAALRAKVQAAAENLRSRNRAEWDFVSRLAPIVGQVCRALCRQPHHINRFGSADWGSLEPAGPRRN